MKLPTIPKVRPARKPIIGDRMNSKRFGGNRFDPEARGRELEGADFALTKLRNTRGTRGGHLVEATLDKGKTSHSMESHSK